MSHVVLLGDSVFDNASYVPGEAPVIEQLRRRLPSPWKATLLAVDGHVTADVIGQTAGLPLDASHLVISCGGNDALGYGNLLYEPAKSVAEVLQRFTSIRWEFQNNYTRMLADVLRLGKPTAVCTIYDSIPEFEPAALTALALFNEIILREAFSVGVPLIDLRLVFTAADDYSALSPIEPSASGGEKITQAIWRLLRHHDFNQKQSVVYA